MAAEDKNVEKVLQKELSKQFYEVFRKVIVTEKATRMIEFENKLMFEVVRGATKPMIKLLVENELGKKVKRVNTVNSITGEKRAIVTFIDEGAASDLSAELGLV